MRTLDWRRNADLRSFDHLYLPVERRPVSYDRILGAVLDQGNIGACTGFGSTAALSSRRPRIGFNEHALAVYELATSRDPYPGDWPTADTGSSVNAAMRALRDLHRVRTWDWVSTVDAVKDAIANVGPCVIGSPWYASMWDPAVDGTVTVDTDTDLVGGHCFCLFGYDPGTVTMRNSWGKGWGAAGDALLPIDGLRALIGAGAEIAVPHLW